MLLISVVVIIRLPVDLTLYLSLKVSGVLAAYQCHLDVLMRVWLQLSAHRLQLDVIPAHQARLSEVELQPLSRVHIVQDDKPAGELARFKLPEVNLFQTKGSHGPVVVQVRSALGQILVEGELLRPLVFEVVAVASQPEGVGLRARAFNVRDSDGEVQRVVLGFQGAEEGVDELGFIGQKGALRVLDVKHSEVVVLLV